jgi:XTP/dITP diphosphohydrolase
MPRILIASQNIHKIEEITPVLVQAGFEVTDARMHVLPEPVEDSGSFVGNARIKAKAAMEATGMAVVADDSGIIIDALSSDLAEFPGVETAPHAKECGGYPQAIAEIFKMLDGRPANCHFVSVLLVRFPDGREIIATGKVHGILIPMPRGDRNFGYDPWFKVPELGKTFAELPIEEKFPISHRGRALQDLLRQLKAIA